MPLTDVVLNITMSLLAILAIAIGVLIAMRLTAEQPGEGRARRRGHFSTPACLTVMA